MLLLSKENFIKGILPILIILVAMSGTTYIYQVDQGDTHKGDANFQLSYTYFVTNEGPVNLTSMTVRLAKMKTWDLIQTVSDISVHTEPNKTTSDEYDNEFVWYEFDNFGVGQSVALQIDANVTVHMLDYSNYELSTQVYDTTTDAYRLYTAFDSDADTTDLRIQQTANQIVSSTDILDQAFSSYNFSASYLNYRLLSTSHGASFALSHGYGDCDEYQNLFIALSRANGIPAIGHTAWLGDFDTGYKSTDQGVLAHAYPMFLTPEGDLLPVDPTRGKDALFDNWLKTDYKRITMTRGPDHPYRLLNYNWLPVEGLSSPSVVNNYTIQIHQLNVDYFSKVRFLIIATLIGIPILFIIYSTIVALRGKQERDHKLKQLLEPSLKSQAKEK